MTTARMYNAWEVVPQMASSYATKDGRVAHNRADIMSDRGEAIASWGLYASLDDMIAFDAALRGGKLIAPKDLAMMWSNGVLASGALSPSGIAFNSVTYIRNHRAASKGGQAGVNYTFFSGRWTLRDPPDQYGAVRLGKLVQRARDCTPL
jgi:hypothetical protein